MSEVLPNFEDLTVDQLIEYKVEQKDIVNAAHERARAANAVYDRKVFAMHRDEAIRQMEILAAASGRTTEEEARYWLTATPANSDPGRRVQANLVLGRNPHEGVR